MSKEDLKQSGREVGSAFKQLGKTLVRSVDRVADKTVEWANSDENGQPVVEEPNSTVFSDGSWKKTAKGLGDAAVSMGKSIANTIDEKVEDVEAEAYEKRQAREAADVTDDKSGDDTVVESTVVEPEDGQQ